jgi:hypothetical protein
MLVSMVELRGIELLTHPGVLSSDLRRLLFHIITMSFTVLRLCAAVFRDGTPNRRFRSSLAVLVAGFAAALITAAPAAATPEEDYFSTLAEYGSVVWDYPAVLTQGRAVCGLLYHNINPHPWLMLQIGYDSYSASSIIAAAKVELCPGNAVTFQAGNASHE